ncbi:MAG: hypothetical protein LBD10_06445 [Desulfobulbus sp.]|uniref:hypothetical protein n=1 Tax=Desulfobulbus sp. TaxID=895 RepID=UPI002840B028|nr:hypothetical protein [Desulfobulbus sp.]MDR2549818.1 hypothetical protein [Desulfobulbus sp.]
MIKEARDKLAVLLQGKVPDALETEHCASEEERQLANLLNELFTYMQEVHQFIVPLSQGNISDLTLPPPRNFLSSPFKELHSRLMHLTWQAGRVAQGDYSQQIDFMGDFSEAFNKMIVSLDRNERELKIKIAELETALSRISQLEGILPICSSCKRIRLEGADPGQQDSWEAIESYITAKTQTMFSHGLCPECVKALYSDFT